MAPPKGSRATIGDDKLEGGSGSKDKGAEGKPMSAKMRRGASQSSASHLREVANAPTSAPSQAATETAAPAVCLVATIWLGYGHSAPGPLFPTRSLLTPCFVVIQINWASFERDILHSYRREHQIATPTSFASTFHKSVMSRPGSIGQYSPTMIRKQQNRRQSKEGLAKAVRKHFNGLGVQENDVIVDFIYRIRSEKAAKGGGPNTLPAIITE